MITRAIDILIELDGCKVGRMADDSSLSRATGKQAAEWAVFDEGRFVAPVHEHAAEVLITPGYVEDLSDDVMDEPIYAMTPLGLKMLWRAKATVREREAAEAEAEAAKAAEKDRAAKASAKRRLAQRVKKAVSRKGQGRRKGAA